MISVLLVDDDPLVRSALRLVLGGQDDITVAGEAGDGRAGLALVRELAPDVVLMDLRMPVLDGLTATRELQAAPFPPRVVVLTTFDADQNVIAALDAGAAGFLLKDTPPADIVAAVRTVVAGEPILSPSATTALIHQVRSRAGAEVAAARTRLDTLTPRELEVALAVARGLSNAEVGAELYLSVPTVKAHVSQLFVKLGAANRVQIAICVHQADLG